MFRFSRTSAAKDCDSPGLQTFPYPITPCPRSPYFLPISRPERLDLASVSTSRRRWMMIRAIDAKEWTPEFPMVVFSCLGESLLRMTIGILFGIRFGVPVFEYLLDADGKIRCTRMRSARWLACRWLTMNLYRAEIIEEDCCVRRSRREAD